MLNPFDVLGLGSAGFNPSDTLDPKSPNFYDDAAALGEALIKMEGKDPHWSESPQGLLVALIMWDKLKNGDKANLENVRALVTQPDTWERYTGGAAIVSRDGGQFALRIHNDNRAILDRQQIWNQESGAFAGSVRPEKQHMTLASIDDLFADRLRCFT
jgi:hypothetical protein